MRLFSSHNNSDFLKLAEEGRPSETDFVSNLDENSFFRVNVNQECFEQLINENETYDWLEELGFFVHKDYFLSRSVALIDDLAIQVRIPRGMSWNTIQTTPIITSGIHFEQFQGKVSFADRVVGIQDKEGDYYKLAYLTIDAN